MFMLHMSVNCAGFPHEVAKQAGDPQCWGIRTGPGHSEVWLAVW